MENKSMDKSLFFLTLSFVCLWLVVDVAIGQNYVGRFLSTLFPFMTSTSSTVNEITKEEQKETTENAPSSSAWGSNKTNKSKDTNDAGINSVPYGAALQG